MATLITSQGLAPDAVDGAAIAPGSVDLTTKVSNVLPIANGGTNSAAALNNNRVMISNSGAVVEAAAITASRALISDSNGIPSASSVTATELGYVSGVTSAIQTQLNGKQPTGNYITALTSDVSASGPGSAAATVNSVGGRTAAQISTSVGATLAATSANTANTIVQRDASGNFAAGTITAATLNVSTAFTLTDAIFTVQDIGGSFLYEVNPGVQTVTLTDNAGSNSQMLINGFSAYDAATFGACDIVGGQISLTENGVYSVPTLPQHATTKGWVDAQLAGKQPTGNYITALTGDATATGPGSAALTLATVNSNVGSFGSSTAIPSFTVNAKGLITAASTNAVIAPAGTLTGTTLNSTVVNSSLTSVGTITSGTWNGTAITETRGGTNQTSYTTGDTLYASGANTLAKLPIGTVNQVLSVSAGGVPTWTTPSNFTPLNNKVYYVSASGNDSNSGIDPTRPFLTLGAALTAAGSSGNQICVFPGTYAGTFTITQQNLTISACNYETGGIVNFTGTLNVNHTASSVRITGCSFATINHQNTGSLYLQNCKTTSALNLSGNAYFESSYSESTGPGTATVSVTGSGNKVFTNGCKVGALTINNAAAVVNLASNISCNPIVVLAGSLAANDTYIYSASATANAITATGATSAVFIYGTQFVTPAGGNARISIGASVTYNIRNAIFDRANSVLSGNLAVTPLVGDTFGMRSQELYGSTSGTLTIQPSASTTSHTLTMPSAQGAANTFLRNNGAGVLTWQAAAAALTPYIYTLTGTDISNKFITLPATPTQPTNTLLTVIGGPAQDYGVDYTVTTNQLGWNGLTLDGVLVTGDKLQVLYI